VPGIGFCMDLALLIRVNLVCQNEGPIVPEIVNRMTLCITTVRSETGFLSTPDMSTD